MNRRAKFYAHSFIIGGESVTVQTHTQNYQKKKQTKTVNDISSPCLSACVDINMQNYMQIYNAQGQACLNQKREQLPGGQMGCVND